MAGKAAVNRRRLSLAASSLMCRLMLIVTSLAEAPSTYAERKPARVVSLLGEDEQPPTFVGLPADRHLLLYVEDESCAAAIKEGAHTRADALVRFLRDWDGDGGILVHCNRGVSRSTAAAFIIMCALRPDACESELMAQIRAAAPHADPCPLIIHYADEILGREGRMLDAAEDLGPPCAVLAAPATFLPLAA